MAVLEALGCGLPALVADAPSSAARALAVSRELCFAPGDAGDLARRLDALLDDPARLVAARAACAPRAAEHAFARSVDRLDAIWRRVAAARGTSPTPGGATAAGSRATPGAR